jgi:hypothetical protein
MYKYALLFLLAILLALPAIAAPADEADETAIPYEMLLAGVRDKAVRTAVFDGTVIHVIYTDGRKGVSRLRAEDVPAAVGRLAAAGVTVEVRMDTPPAGFAGSELLMWFPLLLFTSPLFAAMAFALWHAIRRK